MFEFFLIIILAYIADKLGDIEHTLDNLNDKIPDEE